jgi:hypothetical protein
MSPRRRAISFEFDDEAMAEDAAEMMGDEEPDADDPS